MSSIDVSKEDLSGENIIVESKRVWDRKNNEYKVIQFRRKMNARELMQQEEDRKQAPALHRKHVMASLRAERDRRLAETDWVELPTNVARFSAEERNRWANYRQALRDITKTVSNWQEPEWPEKPV